MPNIRQESVSLHGVLVCFTGNPVYFARQHVKKLDLKILSSKAHFLHLKQIYILLKVYVKCQISLHDDIANSKYCVVVHKKKSGRNSSQSSSNLGVKVSKRCSYGNC